jgi:uncharacterized protein involved in exopolysaccharide biosynthesis
MFLVSAAILASLAPGQNRPGQSGGNSSSSDGDIPQAALLSEKGTQLAEQLRHLRHTEAKLGAKHPQHAEIQSQIADIKRELSAWEPEENPFLALNRSASDPAELSVQDLRQLVLQLAGKVAQLEARVEKLERSDRGR